MANIVFKTRGNSNPQGKSRVYFCAHPKDYGVFFEEISEDVLKYQNCAIWYDSEPSADYDKDELMSHLSQMNLFVIPVTYRFLKEDCRARTVEFQYAIDNHIPVLPLMQEDGLDALFNEICGDLQFLYKGAKDDTAISFDEKLEKFLNSVLIGDELAEKIRAAFDAYIFLSYRKKDRKYAQELMRLIHKNDFCRDIAIWYDEFLVPGENFNDLIAKALEKSSLFTLAVTPNLVNEENYVMTVEYPEAKKAGKKILPAELVPTDKGELSDKFEGIPDCADAYGVELPEALMRAFEELAIKENDNSPEHNFFIGLAYLGGIDVEVDHERAVKLITSAAEAGLPEAMEKLVSMYRNGEGVERNYKTAIEWQRKLVESCKALYEESQTEDSATDYLDALWHLGDYIYELRDIPEAKKIHSHSLETSAEMHKKYGTNEFLVYMGIFYDSLGDVHTADGNLDSALTSYIKSLEIFEAQAQDPNSEISNGMLISGYSSIANTYRVQGKLNDALTYYEKAIKLAEAMLAEDDSHANKEHVASCYSNIAYVYKAREKTSKKAIEQDLTIAITFYKKALDILSDALKEANSVQTRRIICLANINIAAVYKEANNSSNALIHLKKALEISEALAGETDVISDYIVLSICYNKTGNIYIENRDFGKGTDCYERALKASRKATSINKTMEALQFLASCHSNLGAACFHQGEPGLALIYFKKALSIFEGLADGKNIPDIDLYIAITYHNISDAESTKEKKLKALRKSKEIYERLATNSPGVKKFATGLQVVTERLKRLE